jgi:hypothetical protein
MPKPPLLSLHAKKGKRKGFYHEIKKDHTNDAGEREVTFVGTVVIQARRGVGVRRSLVFGGGARACVLLLTPFPHRASFVNPLANDWLGSVCVV